MPISYRFVYLIFMEYVPGVGIPRYRPYVNTYMNTGMEANLHRAQY